MNSQTRRNFLKSSLATGLAGTLASRLLAADARAGIPYRKLGTTGEEVSLVGLGGFHIGMQKTEEESIRIIRTALDAGLNFLDNCWDYNDGASEIRMGKALRDGYRAKAFLMTKIDGRTAGLAGQQIDESLKRLQTDRLDLLQLHEIIRLEDPERIFSVGGAIDAVVAAKKAGKIRFIGFTGHKNPAIHLKMLEIAKQRGFHFDTVQMPLNVMDAHFESFEARVVPEVLAAGAGVLGMKSMGDHEILKCGAVSPTECLHYAMNLPTSVVITGCDTLTILNQALDAARSFKPMDQAGVAALLAKTAPFAGEGKYELYKTTQHFDATSRNPQWLG